MSTVGIDKRLISFKHSDHKRSTTSKSSMWTKSAKVALCKALMRVHNQGMHDDQKQQTLFRTIAVPDNSIPRPESAIEFDRLEAIHKSRYMTQLAQKHNWGYSRDYEMPGRLPQLKDQTESSDQ